MAMILLYTGSLCKLYISISAVCVWVSVTHMYRRLGDHLAPEVREGRLQPPILQSTHACQRCGISSMCAPVQAPDCHNTGLSIENGVTVSKYTTALVVHLVVQSKIRLCSRDRIGGLRTYEKLSLKSLTQSLWFQSNIIIVVISVTGKSSEIRWG